MNKLKPLVIQFCGALTFVTCSMSQQTGAPGQRIEVHWMKSLHHAVSRPLRDLPVEVSVPGANNEVREIQHQHFPVRRRSGPWRDPALQIAAQTLLSATIGLNFEGVGQGQYNFNPVP
jgi:hypothetical protein